MMVYDAWILQNRQCYHVVAYPILYFQCTIHVPSMSEACSCISMLYLGIIDYGSIREKGIVLKIEIASQMSRGDKLSIIINRIVNCANMVMVESRWHFSITHVPKD